MTLIWKIIVFAHKTHCFDWNVFPYSVSTQNIGSKWLNSNTELCLFVPSAATPEGLENIVVVNPLYPQISQLKLKSSTSTLYNKRAFQGLDR
jgi:hypothetical protein